MKKILYGIGIVLIFLAGVFITRLFYKKEAEAQRNIQSVVLLEKVKKVCKLVTIEGNFAEVYNEANIRPMTLYLPFPTVFEFSKKALLQVKGTVYVGYDMEQVTITADSARHVLIIRNLPEPKILSIDHELSYMGLEESFFNSFTPDDYTQLNKNAKEVLKKKAAESGLLEEAREQGNQMLSVITYMATSVGWRVEIDNDLIPVLERDSFPD
ncbi:MAG: DUF4230 domain-containing protein [Saprospiraceae bacterium]|nr:DUF4230 domain-containing protein [Saprospiraceae bacterium]MCB9324438.1 DUF4230 domain-containing protein [Lewinellaceae bacterium]